MFFWISWKNDQYVFYWGDGERVSIYSSLLRDFNYSVEKIFKLLSHIYTKVDFGVCQG